MPKLHELLAIEGPLKNQAEKNKEYDQHLTDCNAKAVQHATFEGRVEAAHQATQGQISLLDSRCERMEKMAEKMDNKLDRLLERG